MELDIWLQDRLVARTRTAANGKGVAIVYDDSVVAETPGDMPLLSCSLPTPGPSEPGAASAYLEGLLPDGRVLEAMAAQVREVQLHNRSFATPADAVALLGEFGLDCAGAAVFVPAGTVDAPPRGEYLPLGVDGLATTIANLAMRPLGADRTRDVRATLAGGQPKLPLALVDDRWWLAAGGAATTHILKPSVHWPFSAENEALVMHLARSVGLTACASWTEFVGHTSVYVVERFDRRTEDGRVVRTHQEDLCQALSLRPAGRYRSGRLSQRIAPLIRRFGASAEDALRAWFTQLAFRAVVGDEDDHAKNFSLLLEGARVLPSPLYDSMCTLMYPELSGSLAMPIGSARTLADVDRAALVDEGVAMGLERSVCASALEALGTDLGAAVAGVPSSLLEGWPGEWVLETVRRRAEVLGSGEPLGEATGTVRRDSVRRALYMSTERSLGD